MVNPQHLPIELSQAGPTGSADVCCWWDYINMTSCTSVLGWTVRHFNNRLAPRNVGSGLKDSYIFIVQQLCQSLINNPNMGGIEGWMVHKSFVGRNPHTLSACLCWKVSWGFRIKSIEGGKRKVFPSICICELILSLQRSRQHESKHLIILLNPTRPYQTPLNEQSDMNNENKHRYSNGSDWAISVTFPFMPNELNQ